MNFSTDSCTYKNYSKVLNTRYFSKQNKDTLDSCTTKKNNEKFCFFSFGNDKQKITVTQSATSKCLSNVMTYVVV